MSETLKQNEELAKSVTGFLDKYGAKLYDSVKKVYKDAYDESRINWRFGYEKYLDNALDKYSKAKTFLSFNQPLPLYDLYVPLSVDCDGHLVENTSIKDLLDANKFSIIMATGGSGKTMMMRHLFVDTIKHTSRVPVFVELRDLNDSDLDLFGLIKKKLRDNKFGFGDDYIKKAFEAGHFVLLLDGFDEVAYTKRTDTIKQLNEIIEIYEKNCIIISSRPDDFLYARVGFNIWKVKALTLNLACQLVEKTEVKQEIKEKFIIALEEELYEKHKSFLSNPLLLAIMLITYENIAKIPDKISTFYERAYTALFDQHDARNKAFHRDKLSNLDIYEFKMVFSAFCFFTYRDYLYNFSQAKTFEYIDKAQKYTELKFKNEDFLHDCIQAVCLLLKDGLEITFSHRSFQEYFIAEFVAKSDNSKFQKAFLGSLLNKISNRKEVFDLLFEISPETIEKHLIIPKLEKLESIVKYNENLTIDSYKNVLIFLYSSLNFQPHGGSFGGKDNNYYWEISATADAVNYVELINRFITKYIKFNPDKYFNQNSELFNILTANRKTINQTSFEINLEDKQVVKSLSEGKHWLSMHYIQEIIDVKNQLIEKHKNKDMYLEKELSE